MIVSIDLGVGEDVMKDCLGDVRELIAVVAYLRSEQMRNRGIRAVPCPHWNPRARTPSLERRYPRFTWSNALVNPSAFHLLSRRSVHPPCFSTRLSSFPRISFGVLTCYEFNVFFLRCWQLPLWLRRCSRKDCFEKGEFEEWVEYHTDLMLRIAWLRVCI